MIRVLIVDDSAFMRKAIATMLEDARDISIAGTARDGEEAIELIKTLKPDVVTMDIEMPRLDGLSALRRIMKEHPVPVIMVSSLTTEGAAATMDALQAGAVDFIPKQLSYVSLDFVKLKDELVAKVRAAAQSRTRTLARRMAAAAHPAPPARPHALRHRTAHIVTLGVSTGGPFSLQKVIPALPADFPLPVAIVQHMPPNFTRSLAERLDGMSALHVVEAQAGMDVEKGSVYIAPGGKHLVFRRLGGRVVLETPEEPTDVLHKPSVDVMFDSACRVYGGDILAVIMTGMGKDGLAGARLIKQSGGSILAQDEETCVVYGMPRAIAEAGIADAVLPLEQIAPALVAAVRPVAASSVLQR